MNRLTSSRTSSVPILTTSLSSSPSTPISLRPVALPLPPSTSGCLRATSSSALTLRPRSTRRRRRTGRFLPVSSLGSTSRSTSGTAPTPTSRPLFCSATPTLKSSSTAFSSRRTRRRSTTRSRSWWSRSVLSRPTSRRLTSWKRSSAAPRSTAVMRWR
ncbi:hypothetical protein CSOJ01_11410 [Colletotrichum sojae]|uniref:Uncharacterized protein n=1 Tax=Colletotrichum sojae TaxID=2175907 RepID=A0A8H6IYG3_9PEZI|nr:hypothetical protein CSOJ01_11410 [Colletotrichum sojae]